MSCSPVELAEKKLIPTTLGRVVTELLVEHFPSIVDYGFTSSMEQQLDDIAEGQKRWGPVLRDFYGPFERTLVAAKEKMRNVKREDVPTELDCPKCKAGALVIKFGRNGEFVACNRYPDCEFTGDFHRDEDGQIVINAASAPEMSDVMCNLCGKPMIIRSGRYGEFLSCTGYPECKNTKEFIRNKEGQIEIKRGIYPVGGATIRLPREIGWANAMRYLLTGDEIDAPTALRLGLVQEVTAHGKQLERATAIAETIAAQAPLGVRATLASSRFALESEAVAAQRLLPDLAPLLQSDDAREGIASFLERRTASFTGK